MIVQNLINGFGGKIMYNLEQVNKLNLKFKKSFADEGRAGP